ncbi:hypothetical protein Gotur_025771 [Gossypium turneri]
MDELWAMYVGLRVAWEVNVRRFSAEVLMGRAGRRANERVRDDFAKVSWIKPKAGGGIELKDLNNWNKGCMLQQTGAIIIQASSLWIAWIRAYILKGRTLWDMPLTPNCKEENYEA